MSTPVPLYDSEFSSIANVATLLNERAAQGWTLACSPTPTLFISGNVHSVLLIFKRDKKVRRPLRGSK